MVFVWAAIILPWKFPWKYSRMVSYYIKKSLKDFMHEVNWECILSTSIRGTSNNFLIELSPQLFSHRYKYCNVIYSYSSVTVKSLDHSDNIKFWALSIVKRYKEIWVSVSRGRGFKFWNICHMINKFKKSNVNFWPDSNMLALLGDS